MSMKIKSYHRPHWFTDQHFEYQNNKTRGESSLLPGQEKHWYAAQIWDWGQWDIIFEGEWSGSNWEKSELIFEYVLIWAQWWQNKQLVQANCMRPAEQLR